MNIEYLPYNSLRGQFAFQTTEAYHRAVEAQDRFNLHVSNQTDQINAYIDCLASKFDKGMEESYPANIFHIHIPKCAGSTIDENIYLQLRSFPGSIFEFNGTFDQYEAFKAGPRRKALAVIGHAPSGIEKQFDGEFVSFAQLRNGYERMVSEYYYMNNISENLVDDYSQDIRKKNFSIESFLSTLQSWQVNPQSKYLSGRHPISEDDEIEIFQDAMSNLMERIWMVTPVKMTNMMINIIARRFGWGAVRLERVNKTADHLGLRDNLSLREAFQPYCCVDQLLFTIVSSAWDRLLPRLPPSRWKTLTRWSA